MLSGKQVRSRSWLAGTLLASFATEHQVDGEPGPGRSVPVPSPNAPGHLADWAVLSVNTLVKSTKVPVAAGPMPDRLE